MSGSVTAFPQVPTASDVVTENIVETSARSAEELSDPGARDIVHSDEQDSSRKEAESSGHSSLVRLNMSDDLNTGDQLDAGRELADGIDVFPTSRAKTVAACAPYVRGAGNTAF